MNAGLTDLHVCVVLKNRVPFQVPSAVKPAAAEPAVTWERLIERLFQGSLAIA